MNILANRIRYGVCGDVIESKSVHDYKRCRCGRISVDGSTDCLKRSFTESLEDFEDLSITGES